ncbi:MAG TPA: asparagine synthase (glutamine-hydrolyzing) [Candidatus Nanoarchaeia archaeon]|nr:asparagine synthase (glutamine-hydrolyzing) [Candidatus Nanoarchaeia archaeon]
MCGICGVNWEDKTLVKKMADQLVHRGPDDEAYYLDKGISLGMRRLAIIDLKKGLYPVRNKDETVFLVFNGEIYNFPELKAELEMKGYRFRTNCDAEVITYGYDEFGIKVLDKLNGMFAIALWDARKKELILARDRFGEKPLYYYHKEGKFAFASELKALLPAGIDRSLDNQALHDFLTLLYLPGDATLFKYVKKLLPAHYLIFKNGKVALKKYWSLSSPKTLSWSEADAARELRRLLEKSVQQRLISDVPLGAFLSGGIDSSTIVGIMSQLTKQPVKTFSVGFGEESDELQHAKVVAEHFNTDHHELLVTSSFAKRLPEVVYHTDVPTADPTCIPTFYLSEFARKRVTVVLTGEGADEEFFGYSRIQRMLQAQQLAQRYNKIPSIIRKGVKVLVKAAPTLQVRRKLKRLPNLEDLPTFYMESNGVLSEEEKEGIYSFPFSGKPTPRLFKTKNDLLASLSSWDLNEYLPNDILIKADTMTMAHSLEGRVPFLDPKIAEFSQSIQTSFKLGPLKNPVEKYILRKSVQDLLPASILKRKKQGFTVPLDKWFQKDLKEVAGHLLSPSSLKESGVFDAQKVKKLYPPLGKIGGYYRLWPLVYFQVWHKMYVQDENPLSGKKKLERFF